MLLNTSGIRKLSSDHSSLRLFWSGVPVGCVCVCVRARMAAQIDGAADGGACLCGVCVCACGVGGVKALYRLHKLTEQHRVYIRGGVREGLLSSDHSSLRWFWRGVPECVESAAL